jgi:hypothetical protein
MSELNHCVQAMPDYAFIFMAAQMQMSGAPGAERWQQQL